MKLLLLSERLPYPPTSGTKNLLYNYCRILHNNLGLDIVNISFLEQDDNPEKRPDFIKKTYVLQNSSGIAKIKNIIWNTLIKRKYPLQVSLFWDEKIKTRIYEIIDAEKPDCVIADFIRTTEYLKDYKGFKIADLQDLLSLRYQRQLSMDLQLINPYGAYLYRLPKAVQFVLQNKHVKESVMKLEISLLRKFEISIGKNYDRVMFVAKKEASIFDEMLGEKKSLVAPLGVDYDFFSEVKAVEKKKHAISFMGALNVAHNEYGIMHFVKASLPRVLSKIPDAKLYIIGGGASEKLKKLKSDSVIFLGRVPDVRVPIQESDVFVCPLQFGSGIKTKNLEAMAMGVPVVTTSIGAENIDAENKKAWLVADDDDMFADSIVDLMRNEETRLKIAAEGQKFVKTNFKWECAQRAFEEAIM